MCFWVGSFWDLGLRTTQRAVLINKFQYFLYFAFLQFLITQDVWSPTIGDPDVIEEKGINHKRSGKGRGSGTERTRVQHTVDRLK